MLQGYRVGNIYKLFLLGMTTKLIGPKRKVSTYFVLSKMAGNFRDIFCALRNGGQINKNNGEVL